MGEHDREATSNHEEQYEGAHESHRQGFGSLWSVADAYSISDGKLERAPRLSQSRPFYMPPGFPELATDYAQLHEGDTDAVLGFAHRWGHLGYGEMAGVPLLNSSTTEGSSLPSLVTNFIGTPDPLDWIWAHARGVRACLAAAEYLRTGTAAAVGEFPLVPLAGALTRWPFHLGPPREGMTYGKFGVGDHVQPLPLDDRPPNPGQARLTISWILNHNLRGLTPQIDDQYEGRLKLGYEFDALLHVIYWHVARYALDSDNDAAQMARCEECSKLFEKVHGRQRYCPPTEWESRSAKQRGGKAESLCSTRARSRRLREGKR